MNNHSTVQKAMEVAVLPTLLPQTNWHLPNQTDIPGERHSTSQYFTPSVDELTFWGKPWSSKKNLAQNETPATSARPAGSPPNLCQSLTSLRFPPAAHVVWPAGKVPPQFPMRKGRRRKTMENKRAKKKDNDNDSKDFNIHHHHHHHHHQQQEQQQQQQQQQRHPHTPSQTNEQSHNENDYLVWQKKPSTTTTTTTNWKI